MESDLKRKLVNGTLDELKKLSIYSFKWPALNNMICLLVVNFGISVILSTQSSSKNDFHLFASL